MIRSRTVTPRPDEEAFDRSKARFRVIQDPSPSSEVSSTDIEPVDEKDSEQDVSKGFSQISADTPVNLVFEHPQKLTRSSLRRQNEAMGELSEEAEERFQFYTYSASPISSQIPQLGWCCDHFGTITSILSCGAAFSAGAVMLWFKDDTRNSMLYTGAFFIIVGCILFTWSIREILILYAKKKFLRDQRQRMSQAGSQVSTSRHIVQLSHTGSQVSPARHIHETELTVVPPAAYEKLSTVQAASQPTTSRHFEESEFVTSTPPETTREFSETPEGTDKPISPKGKYPPKGDYRKGKRLEYYIETDL